MPDLEKVIKGLDAHCTHKLCDDCPYDDRNVQPFCLHRLMTDALELLKEQQPTVDAVPVVRCKDCKWFDVTWEPVHATKGCYFCQMHGLVHEPDYYCADGERRESE